MGKEFTRRDFLRRSGTAVAGMGLAAAACATYTKTVRAGEAASPNERVAVGIIGMGGRGQLLMRKTVAANLADVVAVCDADQGSVDAAAGFVEKKSQKAPQRFTDFRKMLEMKELQAVIIATPDHWHPLQTILACQAGKDVYVEKPISHDIAEGLAMIKAVRDNKRICQVGLMQRVCEDFNNAITYVQSGKLGKVGFVRAWYVKKRDSLGNPPDGNPPAGLDWDMWLGPAPKVPFNPARYRVDLPSDGPNYGSWRWFWDYAGGQLCDWGPHMLDVVRWGMKLGMPQSASASGGKLVFNDCRECPDTLEVVYDYPGVSVLWEHRQWSDRAPEPGHSHGIEFYGDKASLFVDRDGWAVYAEPGGEKAPEPKTGSEQMKAAEENLIGNFIACIKSRKEPTMPIEEGFMTTAACQLGNISFRSGTKVLWDDAAKTIPNNPEAMKYFGRPYRAPWKLPA